MKLQAELENLVERIQRLPKDKVMDYKEQLIASKDYKSFETKFAWDLLRGTTPTSDICEWYKKYSCNDTHVTTLAIKACKKCGYL